MGLSLLKPKKQPKAAKLPRLRKLSNTLVVGWAHVVSYLAPMACPNCAYLVQPDEQHCCSLMEDGTTRSSTVKPKQVS